MTKKEAIVLSAYTGVILCDFEDYQRYAEKLFGCTLCAGEVLMLKEDIKERATEDAMKIINNITIEEFMEEESKEQNGSQMILT